jgi:hypothetical protein
MALTAEAAVRRIADCRQDDERHFDRIHGPNLAAVKLGGEGAPACASARDSPLSGAGGGCRSREE